MICDQLFLTIFDLLQVNENAICFHKKEDFERIILLGKQFGLLTD